MALNLEAAAVLSGGGGGCGSRWAAVGHDNQRCNIDNVAQLVSDRDRPIVEQRGGSNVVVRRQADLR